MGLPTQTGTMSIDRLVWTATEHLVDQYEEVVLGDSPLGLLVKRIVQDLRLQDGPLLGRLGATICDHVQVLLARMPMGARLVARDRWIDKHRRRLVAQNALDRQLNFKAN